MSKELPARSGRVAIVMLVVLCSAGLTSYFLYRQREADKSRPVQVDGEANAPRPTTKITPVRREEPKPAAGEVAAAPVALPAAPEEPSAAEPAPMAAPFPSSVTAQAPSESEAFPAPAPIAARVAEKAAPQTAPPVFPPAAAAGETVTENPDASGLLAKNDSPKGSVNTESLLSDWKAPQLCFVVTGQAHGYFEPCGCSERQVGGYARRADFLRYLREDRKWPVVAMDIGGLLKDERYYLPQMKWKLEALVKGLERMKYDALAIGKEDLLYGPQKLFELYQEFKNVDPNFQLPFLGANLTIIDKSLGMPLDYTIVERGGKKIAIVSIYGDEWKKEVGSFSGDELKVAPVEETLTRVLGELQDKKPDLYVLLSHDSLDNSKKWAGKFPQFQLVVSAGGYEDPPKVAEKVGKTTVITSGMKGRTIGVVGYYPDDKAQPLKYTNVEVAPETLKNSPDMIQVMREYQEQLKDNFASLVAEPIPSEKKFIGIETCRECHANSCKIWDGTKHAKGYVTLQNGRKGQEKEFVPRIYDPECLCCHTVGWVPESARLIESGFRDIVSTPQLAGQQCENCHGAASEHVALEMDGSKMAEMLAVRKTLHRDKATAEASCRKCHDGENDLHWEEVGFAKRWADIAHPGKD